MGWITTIATVALAVAAWLAYRSNRELIEASQAQLRTSEAQLDLNRLLLAKQHEPQLVPGDPDTYEIGELIRTEVGPQVFETRRTLIGVENAGAGLAVVQEATARSSVRGIYAVWAPPAVPSGSSRALKLTPHAGTTLDQPAGETIEVEVTYAGVDGRDYGLAFSAQVFPGGEWRVHVHHNGR